MIMLNGPHDRGKNGANHQCETRICEKGDEYVIPAQAKHYAKFLTKSRVMDLFSEKNRYKTKSR